MKLTTIENPNIWVISRYGRPWKGIIIYSLNNKDKSKRLLILLIFDRGGNPIRKRKLKLINSSWIRPAAAPIKEVKINKEWLNLKACKHQFIYRGLTKEETNAIFD